jgi:hypothetical protein
MKLGVIAALVLLGAGSFVSAANAQTTQEMSSKSVKSPQNARQSAPLMIESSKQSVARTLPVPQNAIAQASAQATQEMSSKSVKSPQNLRESAALMIESSKQSVARTLPVPQNAIAPAGALSQRMQGSQKSVTVTQETPPGEPVGAAIPPFLAR